jgi:hypothetical protein
MHPAFLMPPYSVDEILKEKEFVQIQNRRLPVLPTELNFIYLCAHGHKHAWERIDWLYDTFLFHQKFLDGSIDRALMAAKKYQMEREVQLALQLAYDFFSSTPADIPPNLLAHSRAYSQLKSKVIEFQHSLVQKNRNKTLQKINFWKMNAFLKKIKVFMYLIHFKYDTWIQLGRPLKSYYFWALTKTPSAFVRQQRKEFLS